MSNQNKNVRILCGKVLSNKMDKTIVVLVERKIKHPLYGKYITRSFKVHAHDEQNSCKIGNVVKVSPSRPISSTKHWKLVEIVKQSDEQN